MVNPYVFAQIPGKIFVWCENMVLRFKRFNKVTAASSVGPVADRGNDTVGSRSVECKCGVNLMNLMGVFAISVMAFSLVFSLSVVLRDLPSDALWTVVEGRSQDFEPQKAVLHEEDLAQPILENPLRDFLPTRFNKRSCRSRFESVLYHRGLSKKPSQHLISRLRSYEALHKKCGPYTDPYNKTVEDLKFNRHPSTSDCNYLVWISFSGLGNQILTLVSAFLYALLTNRILLIDRGVDIPDLFCEPFPESSWLLPLDFPLTNRFNGFNQKSKESYGNMLKSSSLGNWTEPYMYIHLVHDYHDEDKLFFCNQDQLRLQKIPWLIIKTDNYFTPSLFLIPDFEQELQDLFPDKESVFHLLGRYLLHPTNSVWGLITRYYRAYLSKADVKVGIQIRVFDSKPGPFKHVMDQILSCTMNKGVLPNITREEPVIDPSRKPDTIAVLMTSLSPGYYEWLRNMYWENPTSTGEVIAIYQPSHEGFQQTEKRGHNKKAWAEMYLLSLMDKLVTSSWSTFGYVAQGLGGLKPWILYKAENQTVPEPPCGLGVSIEPCFHAPPFYDCKLKKGTDTGAIVPHVRHCEDMSWGLKLVESHNEL